MNNLPPLLRRVGVYCNDVNDWLTVGGDLHLAQDLTGNDPEDTVGELFEHGVTHVLDLRIEWDDTDIWTGCGLPTENYLYLPIMDSRQHIPDEKWFESIEDFLQQFWLSHVPGDRLYVHCHMGINRAPSAAMIALLYAYPSMTPWEAFMTIRRARPPAGVVYAKYVGIRHIILTAGGWDGDTTDPVYKEVTDWIDQLQTYWSPERIAEVRGGVSMYRSAEGTVDETGALVVQ